MAQAVAEIEQDHDPLISGRTVLKLAIAAILLALLTAAISVAGRHYGRTLALGGHSENRHPVTLLIGEDALSIPANMIRFSEQRRDGRVERADLYLSWPAMDGYSADAADVFNNADRNGSLIFLQFSQSVMTRDMSGRLAPIYTRLFDGSQAPGPAGLVRHGMRADAGFGDEVILTAERPHLPSYVVRCRLPAQGEPATDADCQRDIRVGKDLSLIYRFSSRLLPQWREIDDAVTAFAAARLRR